MSREFPTGIAGQGPGNCMKQRCTRSGNPGRFVGPGGIAGRLPRAGGHCCRGGVVGKSDAQCPPFGDLVHDEGRGAGGSRRAAPDFAAPPPDDFTPISFSLHAFFIEVCYIRLTPGETGHPDGRSPGLGGKSRCLSISRRTGTRRKWKRRSETCVHDWLV